MSSETWTSVKEVSIFQSTQCEHYKDLIDMSIKGGEERDVLKRELKNTTFIRVHAIIYTMHGTTSPKSIC